MDHASPQEVALQQLAAVPGVVGSLIFDAAGKVQASAFPAVFDSWGLAQLAAQLAADAFFQEWMAGDQGLLTLRFVDGQVALRSLGGAYALVFAGAQANEQLLSMSLAQLARRLQARPPPPVSPPPSAAAEGIPVLTPVRPPAAVQPASLPARPAAPPAAAPASPGPVGRLEDLAREELGERAEQALRILAAAGPRTKDQLRAISEVEKLVRLFISKRKAEELARRMRAVLEE